MIAEMTGYVFIIRGPSIIADEGYGFHGTDTPPTLMAEWVSDAPYFGQMHGTVCYYVLREDAEPPTDLPPGWTAQPAEIDDDWSIDDGIWIVKALFQKPDGSWVFAGTTRS